MPTNTVPVGDQPVIKNTNLRLLLSKKFITLFLAILAFCILGVVVIMVSLKKHDMQNQIPSQSHTVNASLSPRPGLTGVSYTQDQLLAITESPADTSALPLGDDKYTTSGPKKGYIYLCSVQQGQGGAQHIGAWVHGTTWSLAEKPSVEGHVSWSNATFSNIISGTTRTISGNDLPVGATSGIFPIQSTDPAYQYDRNPNSIAAREFSLPLPVNPAYSSTPSCMGGEVGVMLDGVALFNGFDADHRDAAAHEVQDSCDGHPQVSGEYHYHSLSRCIQDIHETTVIGYALDGYPITGPVLSNGIYLTTNDLDECHGMTSEIVLDGKKTTSYHYVMTEDFPYSVSCFRGKPVRMQVIPGQQEQGNTTVQGGQMGTQNGGIPQPPQEAFTICNGKSSGANCSFTAPRGNVVGTCQTPPNQSSMVCVPTNSEQNQSRQLP